MPTYEAEVIETIQKHTRVHLEASDNTDIETAKAIINSGTISGYSVSADPNAPREVEHTSYQVIEIEEVKN